MVVQISKKRKFVTDGIFKAELNEFLTMFSVIQKRFGFSEGSVELFAGKVATRGLSIISQAYARACSGMLWFITESRVKGCEVMACGKLQGQRAKSMKLVDGLMVHSEDPVNHDVDTAMCHVLLRQTKPLPDHTNSLEPKDEILPTTPTSEEKGEKPEPPAVTQQALTAL
ncbi:hypothetical protein FD755_018552 [Muntiacus reevesi]|uniref:40S ribosomal protein S3 n=1 Tax=Muntiacus reevesi TaxID=9886 RepID=A0A5N3X8S6_MUNRE|nr:hypothetical protein FD755_018552 [Muntiacus reevesi]